MKEKKEVKIGKKRFFLDKNGTTRIDSDQFEPLAAYKNKKKEAKGLTQK